MDPVFSESPPFVVSATSDAGSGLIAVAEIEEHDHDHDHEEHEEEEEHESAVVVTYSVANALKSQSFALNSTSANAEVDVGMTRGDFTDLFAGSSGFYLATVSSAGVVSIKTSPDGKSAWTPVPSTVITDAVSGPIAGACTMSGSIVLVYHTSVTGLKVFSSSTGTTHALPVEGVSVSVAVAANGTNVIQVVANNAGNVTSSLSINGGAAWSSPPSIVQLLDVFEDSEVKLVSTQSRWLAVFQNQRQDRITFRTSTTDAGTWPQTGSLFTGNATAGKTFGSASLMATGGDGWFTTTIGALDGSVNGRACFNVPVNETRGSNSAIPGKAPGSWSLLLGMVMLLGAI